MDGLVGRVVNRAKRLFFGDGPWVLLPPLAAAGAVKAATAAGAAAVGVGGKGWMEDKSIEIRQAIDRQIHGTHLYPWPLRLRQLLLHDT